MRLYDITVEIERIYDEIKAQNGEITPEQDEELSYLEKDRESKLKNCAAYVSNLDDDCEALEQEIKRMEIETLRLKARLQSRKNEKTGFLAYVGRCLGRGCNWVSPLFDFKWNHTQPVVIDPTIDIRKLPEQYIRYKETYDPNKTELRKALKAGTVIEGIKLGDNWHLRLDRGKHNAQEREREGIQERTESEEVPF